METKNKILVVDDKSIDRYMIGGIFCDEYEIIEAAGGQDAINIIAAEHSALAIVLLDIIMPGINGFGVLDYMNKRNLLDSLPVVVITDDSSEETIIEAFKRGGTDMVLKPFEPCIIKKRVQNIIELYTYKKKYGVLYHEES